MVSPRSNHGFPRARTSPARAALVLLPQRDRRRWQNGRLMSQTSIQGELVSDRVTVGVAARLAGQYLQVLTQARKMGKERISSQEMSDYANINATQIRRDLSAFGKFGKRAVGYSIDRLLAEIHIPHPGTAQHRARRCRAPRPGHRQLADLRRAWDQHRGRVRQGSRSSSAATSAPPRCSMPRPRQRSPRERASW